MFILPSYRYFSLVCGMFLDDDTVENVDYEANKIIFKNVLLLLSQWMALSGK